MICKVAVLVAPSSPPSVVPDAAAPSVSSLRAAVLPGLLEALARVPDPRNPRGVRYRLATLLAVGVRHVQRRTHSLTAIAEWVQRCEQAILARLGCPFDPFAGRFKAPGERTLRDAFGKVDAAALTQAGFARLAALAPASSTTQAPDGVREREQRRAHHAARRAEAMVGPPRRLAFAVDGKCLRGAVRADGSRVFLMTAVRHDDTLTAALREIGAKTNEIPEFAPLLDQIDQADLTDAVITVDALRAQKDHARYLVEQRDAHYLLSVKNNHHRRSQTSGELAKLHGTACQPRSMT
ncbi:transposase family protein [Streptomyces sp. NPDC055722]